MNSYNVALSVLFGMAIILLTSQATYLDNIVDRKLQGLNPAYTAYDTATLQRWTPNHKKELFELQKQLFPKCQYSEEEFIDDIASNVDACLLLVRDNQIIAFVLADPDFELRYDDKRTGYVNLLGVRENHRGFGIGKTLLNEIRRVLKADFDCKYISLHAMDHDSNAAVLKLYHSSGYLVAEKTPNFFPDGPRLGVFDAVFMVRPIEEDWAALNVQELPQLTYFSELMLSTQELDIPLLCK